MQLSIGLKVGKTSPLKKIDTLATNSKKKKLYDGNSIKTEKSHRAKADVISSKKNDNVALFHKPPITKTTYAALRSPEDISYDSRSKAILEHKVVFLLRIGKRYL